MHHLLSGRRSSLSWMAMLDWHRGLSTGRLCPQPKVQFLLSSNSGRESRFYISALYRISPTKRTVFSYQRDGSSPTKRAAIAYQRDGGSARPRLAFVPGKSGDSSPTKRADGHRTAHEERGIWLSGGALTGGFQSTSPTKGTGRAAFLGVSSGYV